MEFLKPWLPASDQALRLERELLSEMGPAHTLKGRNMRALAFRQDCDEVLFVSTDEPPVVAVVHLTFVNRPERDPRWPETTLFDSLQAWIEKGMKADHDAHFG